MNILTVLKKPLVTEKSYKLMEQQKYVFIVSTKAKKKEVKLAFEMIFNVKVQAVNIIKVQSKPRRIGRFAGRTKSFTKAIISLVPNQEFHFFEDVKVTDSKVGTEKKSIFSKFKEQFTISKNDVKKKLIVKEQDEKN